MRVVKESGTAFRMGCTLVSKIGLGFTHSDEMSLFFRRPMAWERLSALKISFRTCLDGWVAISLGVLFINVVADFQCQPSIVYLLHSPIKREKTPHFDLFANISSQEVGKKLLDFFKLTITQ